MVSSISVGAMHSGAVAMCGGFVASCKGMYDLSNGHLLRSGVELLLGSICADVASQLYGSNPFFAEDRRQIVVIAGAITVAIAGILQIGSGIRRKNVVEAVKGIARGSMGVLGGIFARLIRMPMVGAVLGIGLAGAGLVKGGAHDLHKRCYWSGLGKISAGALGMGFAAGRAYDELWGRVEVEMLPLSLRVFPPYHNVGGEVQKAFDRVMMDEEFKKEILMAMIKLARNGVWAEVEADDQMYGTCDAMLRDHGTCGVIPRETVSFLRAHEGEIDQMYGTGLTAGDWEKFGEGVFKQVVQHPDLPDTLIKVPAGPAAFFENFFRKSNANLKQFQETASLFDRVVLPTSELWETSRGPLIVEQQLKVTAFSDIADSRDKQEVLDQFNGFVKATGLCDVNLVTGHNAGMVNQSSSLKVAIFDVDCVNGRHGV